jgi:hypothetical protein
MGMRNCAYGGGQLIHQIFGNLEINLPSSILEGR